jgi:hypothetical protein
MVKSVNVLAYMSPPPQPTTTPTTIFHDEVSLHDINFRIIIQINSEKEAQATTTAPATASG